MQSILQVVNVHELATPDMSACSDMFTIPPEVLVVRIKFIFSAQDKFRFLNKL